MTDVEQPQLYLVTPPAFDLTGFPDTLGRILDEVPVACLRLEMASHDEDDILRAADILRNVAHARDVAIVIADHVLLAERLGLDGVHLSDAARSVRSARKSLGGDAIVGAFCGASRHDAMTAGEAGADYVSFGPVGKTALNDGNSADLDLFQWWSEMIEVPVVAEGGLGFEDLQALKSATDFVALGQEIWSSDDPLKNLKHLLTALD